MREPPSLICPYCGRPTRLVYVHGHVQCELCGTNIDECCRGEVAQEDEDIPVD